MSLIAIIFYALFSTAAVTSTAPITTTPAVTTTVAPMSPAAYQKAMTPLLSDYMTASVKLCNPALTALNVAIQSSTTVSMTTLTQLHDCATQLDKATSAMRKLAAPAEYAKWHGQAVPPLSQVATWVMQLDTAIQKKDAKAYFRLLFAKLPDLSKIPPPPWKASP